MDRHGGENRGKPRIDSETDIYVEREQASTRLMGQTGPDRDEITPMNNLSRKARPIDGSLVSELPSGPAGLRAFTTGRI